MQSQVKARGKNATAEIQSEPEEFHVFLWFLLFIIIFELCFENIFDIEGQFSKFRRIYETAIGHRGQYTQVYLVMFSLCENFRIQFTACRLNDRVRRNIAPTFRQNSHRPFRIIAVV